jgi:hypothetical protein
MFKVWQKYYYGTRMNSAFLGNQGLRDTGLSHINILAIYCKATKSD